MSLSANDFLNLGDVLTFPTLAPQEGDSDAALCGKLLQALNTPRVWYVAPPTAGDDTAKIQAALNAAAAAGGGLVQLAAGTYNLVTINSPASGTKAAGAYCLEIPSNVTLAGWGEATVLSFTAGGTFGTGVCISPAGMRTAVANFGAAQNVCLRDFRCTGAQSASCGNMLNIVHAQNWRVERVHIAGCYYHGAEISRSRRIFFKDVRWSGDYTAGSGSFLQFDRGDAGPVNSPPEITTGLCEDIKFFRCIGEQRTAGASTCARDIEFTHAPTGLDLNRITFEQCHFTGRAEPFVAIADIAGANTSGSVTELLFKDCTFVTTHPKAWAFYMVQAAGMVFRGIRFRGCEFAGASASPLIMGGSTSDTYISTHSLRHEGEVSDCRFIYDKSQLPAATDINLIIAVAWTSFRFRRNYIEANGDTPVGSVGQTWSRLALIANNLSTDVGGNRGQWNGNMGLTVSRSGFVVAVSLLDQAGLTRSLTVEDNVFASAAGTGWNYGISIQNGTTVPAARATNIRGNWCNMANSAQNNVLVTGAAAGQVSSAPGYAVRSVTANTTITEADGIIHCDTTAGNITVTAAHVARRVSVFLYKTNGANTLTCGATSVTADGAGIHVYSDGTTTFTRVIA